MGTWSLTLLGIGVLFQKGLLWSLGETAMYHAALFSPMPKITKITVTLFNSNLREVSITKMKYLVTAYSFNMFLQITQVVYKQAKKHQREYFTLIKPKCFTANFSLTYLIWSLE